MRFTKMQGIGNDYIYVDCFRDRPPEDPAAAAIRLSRRHFSVGADGLILIAPSESCDAAMRVFNADGSEAKMCGNGIRCVGKYLYDTGLCRRKELRIETLSGVRSLSIRDRDGVAEAVTVDMGAPAFGAEDLPLTAGGRKIKISCASMGNPHGVLFVEEGPGDEWFFAAGPELEKAAAFPEGANIEFVKVLARDRLRVRVWERGSGETLACGTGACAALAVAARKGLVDRRARVALPGGELKIDWDEASGRIFMTGPAEIAFTGETDI